MFGQDQKNLHAKRFKFRAKRPRHRAWTGSRGGTTWAPAQEKGRPGFDLLRNDEGGASGQHGGAAQEFLEMAGSLSNGKTVSLNSWGLARRAFICVHVGADGR